MAGLQDLDSRQIQEILADACQRQAPANVTVRYEDHWTHYHSRLLVALSDKLLLESPRDQAGCEQEFAPQETLGVTFKLRHHKYVLVGAVLGRQEVKLTDGTPCSVLVMGQPEQMQRIQRRAFFRADVPEGATVRCSFWLGGRQAEPAGTTPGKPVVTGQVTNISAGGFQMKTADKLPEDLATGGTVGVRVSFGVGQDSIFADAETRHIVPGDESTIGFQFLGLEQDPEGRKTIRIISAKVSEYQRIQLQHMAPADVNKARS